jgi:hypothetical protein
MLPAEDRAYLDGKGLRYETFPERDVLNLIIHDFELPRGYQPRLVDLLLRLPIGWPDAQPDMYWCDPEVLLEATANRPAAADVFEVYLNRRWQRFSRHLAAGQWRPGIDTLETYLTLIRVELAGAA